MAHAFLLLSTAPIWARVLLPRPQLLIVSLGAVVAIAECLVLRHLEQRYLPAVEALRACKPRVVAYNTNASRVALSVDAESYRLVDERDPAGEGDVVVVAPRMQTNRPIAVTTTYLFPPSLSQRLATSCQHIGEFYLFDFSASCPSSGELCTQPAP